MKVSIIIPTFNSGKYLKKAIKSVLRQNYKNFELIIYDSKSTDNTKKVVKPFLKNECVRYILEKDRGQADAINKGLYKATGEIFTFLNADDWFEPNVLKEIVDIFSKNKNVSFLYGNCFLVNKKRKVIMMPPKFISKKKLLNYGNLTFQPATFYKRSTLIKAGGVKNYYVMTEYDMNLNALRHGKPFYLNKVLANFLIRPDQKSRSENSRQIVETLFKISIKHGGNIFSPLGIGYILSYILPIPFLIKIKQTIIGSNK